MGTVYSCKCDKCGYTLSYSQGVGFLYQSKAKEMLVAMKRGEFGKSFMEAANKAIAPWVKYSYELYRCKACGELRPDLQIDLFDGNKVVLSKHYICDKCHGLMSVIKSDRGLKCPECKSRLKKGVAFLWD